MNHSTLKIVTGILKNVSKPTLLERLENENEKLVSPSELYITKADVDSINKGDVSLDVYGILPQNYVGQHITIKQSSYKLGEQNLRVIIQEVYAETNPILNQPVVFRE